MITCKEVTCFFKDVTFNKRKKPHKSLIPEVTENGTKHLIIHQRNQKM